MSNLNYDVAQGVPQDVLQGVPQDGTIDERIIAPYNCRPCRCYAEPEL